MGSTVSAPILQGVQATDVTVDPAAFYANTRRQRFAMRSPTAIAGLGTSDNFTLRKTGVISALEVRIFGNVTIGGTIGTTTMSYEWPYGLVQKFRVSANGQSNLIDARGLEIKAFDFLMNSDLNDRGVSQRIGATTAVNQGTLSLASENWGATGAAANYMAPGTNVAAVGTYPVSLSYLIPIAADYVSLIGSLYGQSQAVNLNLEVQYATQAALFAALGGSATVSFSGMSIEVTGLVYSIPNVNGKFVVPDLSPLHQVNSIPYGIAASGSLEYNLAGTGAGRKLLRILAQAYSSSAPLVVNGTNFTEWGWRYGGQDTPERYVSGDPARMYAERVTSCDIGGQWGLLLWDFASQYALRDVVDTGSTSDLRLVAGLAATPTNGQMWVCQENLFSGVTGA